MSMWKDDTIMKFIQTILNKQNKKIKSRNINLDVIRTFAILFVICIHFLLYTGFYEAPIYGIKLEIMVVFRTISIICVPLFLLLTGYLNTKKNWSKKYYLGIIKILFIYFICSVICYLYYYHNIGYSILEFFKLLFSFQAARYSWYVNMYLGLFLLIPFLNQMYNHLSQKQKKVFVISVFLVGILPSINLLYTPLIPNYWISLWPFSYYFMGMYLKEFSKNYSLKNCAIFFILILVLSCAISMVLNYGTQYHTTFFSDYSSIVTFFLSSSFFLVIIKLKLNELPCFIRYVFYFISCHSFGMYLISYVFDKIIYSWIMMKVVNVGERLYYFIPAVLFVFMSSLVCSFIINILYERIIKKGVDSVVYKKC